MTAVLNETQALELPKLQGPSPVYVIDLTDRSNIISWMYADDPWRLLLLNR